MSADKIQKLLLLVEKRQRRTEIPLGYSCVSEFHDGKYDWDFISLFSKETHNENTDLMVFGQDWSSRESLQKEERKGKFDPKGYTETLQTNKNLQYRLKKHLDLEWEEIYATNVSRLSSRGK